jgi:hypothetical protein
LCLISTHSILIELQTTLKVRELLLLLKFLLLLLLLLLHHHLLIKEEQVIRLLHL